MELHEEHIGSALVLHLEGRMTAESGAEWMRDAMNAVTARGVRHAVLDLAGVSQLDCTGIGQLLRLREQVHGARRTFVLVAIERRQRRMLECSGLSHVFRIFGDRDAAVSALGIGERRRPAPSGGGAADRLAARWSVLHDWAESEYAS
jgi:anti-anti-sigma factor